MTNWTILIMKWEEVFCGISFYFLKWQIQVFNWFLILQGFWPSYILFFRSQWSCWHHTSVLCLSSNQSFLWWRQAHFNAVWWYSELHHECKYSLKAPYFHEVQLFGFMLKKMFLKQNLTPIKIKDGGVTGLQSLILCFVDIWHRFIPLSRWDPSCSACCPRLPTVSCRGIATWSRTPKRLFLTPSWMWYRPPRCSSLSAATTPRGTRSPPNSWKWWWEVMSVNVAVREWSHG